MTLYRISWRPGNSQDGYFHQVEADTEGDAAWFVATSVIPAGADVQARPVLVECAEIDLQSGKPVRPPAP